MLFFPLVMSVKSPVCVVEERVGEAKLLAGVLVRVGGDGRHQRRRGAGASDREPGDAGGAALGGALDDVARVRVRVERDVGNLPAEAVGIAALAAVVVAPHRVAALVGGLRPDAGDAAAAELPDLAICAQVRARQGGAADAGDERLGGGVVGDQLGVAPDVGRTTARAGVAGGDIEREPGSSGQLELGVLGLHERRRQEVLAQAPAVADDGRVCEPTAVGDHLLDHGQELGDVVGRLVDLDAVDAGGVGRAPPRCPARPRWRRPGTSCHR